MGPRRRHAADDGDDQPSKRRRPDAPTSSSNIDPDRSGRPKGVPHTSTPVSRGPEKTRGEKPKPSERPRESTTQSKPATSATAKVGDSDLHSIGNTFQTEEFLGIMTPALETFFDDQASDHLTRMSSASSNRVMAEEFLRTIIPTLKTYLGDRGKGAQGAEKASQIQESSCGEGKDEAFTSLPASTATSPVDPTHGTISMEAQLPQIENRQMNLWDSNIDAAGPPNLLPEVQCTQRSWDLAFFAVSIALIFHNRDFLS